MQRNCSARAGEAAAVSVVSMMDVRRTVFMSVCKWLGYKVITTQMR